MLGAIIGDIVGSVYEFDNIKTKDFELFREDCFFTDDTVMTIATADAIMAGGSREDFKEAYKNWGRKYPHAGYGLRFRNWLNDEDSLPYNSWGNGSAMRVSPVGQLFESMDKVLAYAKITAEVTHNHPEGIKGAQATAAAIFLAKCFKSGNCLKQDEPWDLAELKKIIKKTIEDKMGYDLSATLDEIRPSYRFNESCRDTVPQAVTAFLESTDFEDAIRNAISLGGDSDTLAAITGSIAEAAYGIPEGIAKKALSYLDEPLLEIYLRWNEFIKDKPIK